MALLGNVFGFVNAALIEKVVTVSASGTGERRRAGQDCGQDFDYRVARGVWADAGWLAVLVPLLRVVGATHSGGTSRAVATRGGTGVGAHDAPCACWVAL